MNSTGRTKPAATAGGPAATGTRTRSRLKPCRNHDCRWLFYDHSTNRSGTWCTMAHPAPPSD